MKLSRPQLRALRSARSRHLFATDINLGNERRTYASLFRLGLLDWDPLYQGRVVLTASGAQKLQETKS